MVKVMKESDFARCFGVLLSDIPQTCIDYIRRTDFTYRPCLGKERDEILLTVLQKLETDTQRIASPERRAIWEQGWAENLAAYRNTDYNINALMPRYYHANRPMRFESQYIESENPHFEPNFQYAFKIFVFLTWLQDCQSIYEFGCGSPVNLVQLRELFPEKMLHGLDFVSPPIDLIIEIAERTNDGLLFGHFFDMTRPDPTISLPKNSGVITFGAIEQLGGEFECMLDYLLINRPAIVVQMEPTAEFYDATNLFDYLALRFHIQRGYTQGYYPRLLELHNQGRIELLKAKRLGFGSLFMEGYSYFVWRPL